MRFVQTSEAIVELTRDQTQSVVITLYGKEVFNPRAHYRFNRPLYCCIIITLGLDLPPSVQRADSWLVKGLEKIVAGHANHQYINF